MFFLLQGFAKLLVCLFTSNREARLQATSSFSTSKPRKEPSQWETKGRFSTMQYDSPAKKGLYFTTAFLSFFSSNLMYLG